MQDIYFEPNYGKLYESVENGKCINWEYDGAEGNIKHQFVLREIPIKVGDKGWFDIVTPYGYGGPIICEIKNGYSKEELLYAFEAAFKEYCVKQKIVSEFVRFHPIVRNAEDFTKIYNPENIRNTLITNLKDCEDPVSVEFSKSCKKNINRAIKKGITWRVTVNPHEIDGFKEIYYSTMNRNEAAEYYYFNDEYFESCLKWFGENILYVEAIFEGRTIAAGLYFIYNKTIHIHLSGTLSEYLYLSPAYILRYAVAKWGKENGYELIHHGGGRTNSPEDSLFLFKKQFAQNHKCDFYIGKKIWNKEIYQQLCKEKNINEDTSFFPAYRSGE